MTFSFSIIIRLICYDIQKQNYNNLEMLKNLGTCFIYETNMKLKSARLKIRLARFRRAIVLAD